MRKFVRWSLLLALVATSAWADVKLPAVFGSHMVLQRDREIAVWGTAAADEAVSVTLGDGAAVTAKTGADGRWSVKLPARRAGGPMQLKVKGNNEVALDDVLVGDVWLCSGQSNMEMRVASCLNAAADIAAATDDQIRSIEAVKAPLGYSGTDIRGDWKVCSPQTAGSFTACGYFMARTLRKELGVPIGLINSSWGGTRIEPWCTPESFSLLPELADIAARVQAADPKNPAYQAKLTAYIKALTDWTEAARTAMAAGKPIAPAPAFPAELQSLASGDQPQQQPTTLYHGMVEGLVPFGLKGAIWYQGESNHGEGKLYTAKTEALVRGWRTVFQNPDMPFYWVQIAPFNYGAEPPQVMAEFWEAQAAALKLPNTGMVVTNDISEYNDIHPRNKQEVGRRFALLALKGAYGRKDVVADGPVFKSMALEGDKIRLRFDNVGGGLVSRDDKPLTWFQVIGEETDFEDATAVIDGDSVLVSCPKVPKPLAVTYAWSKMAEPNLANKEGLPARPFRAGEVPKRDYLALRVAEAKDYQLALDLDLANLGANLVYDVDNRAKITGKFDRIGYFLELTAQGKPTQYVWVSMDAFTDSLAKIGVPTAASGAVFQTKVANANIISNAEGIAGGTALGTCNIEFWPHNYGPANKAAIPNADAGVWDFGDEYMDPIEGYGSMQVGNYGAKQTVFAINNWRAGTGADLGIGNSNLDPKPGMQRTRDWTFAGNAGSYTAKRLRVLVRLAK
ncbi:MAG: 9-O-acetylesterase [Armatimonadetes bacterium]|nr:9-O-acetylesterase [Armatimonadota bacterium]